MIDFKYIDPALSERVIGTYLYPYQIFGQTDQNEEASIIEIVARAPIDSHEILITRNGGLFVRPPEILYDPIRSKDGLSPLTDLDAKIKFQEFAATLFNKLICDLTLLHITAEPTTPLDISTGHLTNNHAVISGGWGAYNERTSAPLSHIINNTFTGYSYSSIETLKQATELTFSTKLSVVSENIMSFIAGAYFWYSRRQIGEALINSWIVNEQIISYLWTKYIQTIADSQRKKRLKDNRSYSTAIRLEVLYSLEMITCELYEELNKARKLRNELAHNAVIDLSAATIGLNAMKSMLEFFCKNPVALPAIGRGCIW